MNNPCTQCTHAEHYPRGKAGKMQYNFCTKQGCDKLLKYRRILVSKRKYKQGEPIFSLDDLLLQQFVYAFLEVLSISVWKAFATINNSHQAIKRGGVSTKQLRKW